MWINPLFAADTRQALAQLVSAESLATLVVERPLRAAHLPLVLEDGGDGGIVLVGHVPRADPLARVVEDGGRVLCIFHGPRAYVSPGWYEGAGLPTYNFAVAHLSGPVEPMDAVDLRTHLLDLIRIHEAHKEPVQAAWEPDDTAHARIDQLLPAVLGFRIRVDEAQAKEKIGQNRSAADRLATVEQLDRSTQEEHHRVAALMTEREQGAEPRRTPH